MLCPASRIQTPVGTNLVSSDSDSSILVWCSPKKMDPATTKVSSPRNGDGMPDETELEQLSSDLQALKRLYGLLHKGPANEDLDEASRALLMKMLDDATQQTLLKQAKDDFELKLKEEAMLSRVLKEAVLLKELDIEQLEADLTSSLRLQDVMINEIQRVQGELSCITHKAKQLELQVSKKDEAMNEIQQDFQESAKELAALRGTLKTVTEERDLSWQEAKQLRRNISIMQNEVVSLKKKIEALDEDILLKEGQITILQDSIEKPFDIICSPRSMREFDME